MIGVRSYIANVLKNGCGFSLLRQQIPKPTLGSNVRSLCSVKSAWGTADQQPRHPPLEGMKLISKRFLHYGNAPKKAHKGSLAAKLFAAAVGAAIGLGGKAIFDPNNDGILNGFYQAACARGCGCDDDECVDKKCEDSPCLRSMECEEELIMKANAELETALKEIKAKAIEYTEAAMKAYCAAIKIIQEYMDQGYCLIDTDDLEPPEYEEAWCCLYKIAKERCEKVKDALEKGQCAWELLCRLRECIQNGRNCKYTSCNPLLDIAEQSLLCAEKELLNLKAKMDCVQSEHEMVEQYQTVIENFRKDLKSEVDAMVESGDCKICFAEQETALMIISAYKKAVRVHNEVAQGMICNGNIPDRMAKTEC